MSTFGLGPIVEKAGGQILAYADGRIDLDEYNVGMGEALGEAEAGHPRTRHT